MRRGVPAARLSATRFALWSATGFAVRSAPGFALWSATGFALWLGTLLGLVALATPAPVLAQDSYGVYLAGRDVLVGQKSALEKIPACDTKTGEWGKHRMRGWGLDCSKVVGPVTALKGFATYPREADARAAFCSAVTGRRAVPLTGNRDWEARLGTDPTYYLIRNAPDCKAPPGPVAGPGIRPRDSSEVDTVLDSLGMMLAVAVAAPPPTWGVGRGAIGREPFNWHDAATLAHTVHATLRQLQHQGAQRRLGLTLTPAQVNRIRALGHWVKWIYDRHSAWATRGSWEMDALLLGHPVWHIDTSRDVPPPPPYPLNGPPPMHADWAYGPPPPIPEHVQWFDTIAFGALGTAIDTSVVAAQVADFYFTGGKVFLVLTGGYGLATGNLTPLAWQLVSMTPIKYHGVPTGTAFLASIAALETVTGYELELKTPKFRHQRPNEVGPHGDYFDVRPLGFWDRVGKGSMAALLVLQTSADIQEVTRTAALGRVLEANPAKPLNEGPKAEIREVAAGARDAVGRVQTTLEILQPTIQGDWLLVKMDVLKQPNGSYLHPDTLQPLFLIGRDGYHAAKHFFERYPFGRVIDVTKVKLKQGGPPAVEQRLERVPLDQNPYFTADLRVLETVDGRPVEVPGLKELFGDHPELVAPIRAFEAAATDANYNPRTMQTTYVELINALRRAFRDDMQAFTAKNMRFDEKLTGFMIQRKGYDYYIILKPDGAIINSMTLGRTFNPREIAVGYRLQRGDKWDAGVTGRMSDLVETVLFDRLVSLKLKLKGTKLDGMRYDQRLKALEPFRNDPMMRQALIDGAAFKAALREQALRVYSLGAAAMKERE
jgi:hypothetical protein